MLLCVVVLAGANVVMGRVGWWYGGALGIRTSYDHELGEIVACHFGGIDGAQRILCDEDGVGDRYEKSNLRVGAYRRARSRDAQAI